MKALRAERFFAWEFQVCAENHLVQELEIVSTHGQL